MVSDGRRFVLLTSYSKDGSRVLDTRTGRSVGVQQPCAAAPAGATQGTFAVRCIDDLRSPAAWKLSLVNARTGRVTPVADTNPYDFFDGGLGLQWLAGSTFHPGPNPGGDGGAYGWVFYNWHTGERREFPRKVGYVPPVLNLDTPDLRPGLTPQPVPATQVSSRRLKRNLVRGDTWQVTATHGRRRARWRITSLLPVEDIYVFPRSVTASDEVRTATTDSTVFIGVLDNVVSSYNPSGYPNELPVHRYYSARLPQ